MLILGFHIKTVITLSSWLESNGGLTVALSDAIIRAKRICPSENGHSLSASGAFNKMLDKWHGFRSRCK